RERDSCTIHRRIPEGGFQAVTSNEGERVYLSMQDEEVVDDGNSRLIVTADTSSGSGQLLQVPYSQLKEAALAELHRQAERVVRTHEFASSSPLRDVEEDDEDDNTGLWTDLYRPTHYLHLLSDEMTNRSVLHWIKLWDKFVFGIEKKPRKPKDHQGGRWDNWKDKKGGKFQYRQPLLLPDLREDLEPDGRPAQKLLLLCGAPGLGKTTLAHIIAKHAGYRPVELNASDDRSVDAFRSSIENATSMRSVLDVDRKPNCLIIDEIDGAPAPSIRLLVNFVSGKGLGGKAPSKKGAKEKVFVLQRPVIAICNDLYVPALRSLRPLALVVNFPPTLSTKLAQRLQEVCTQRGLQTDLTCLLALAHKTRNDIRSCLSLLQFVKSKRGALKLSDIEGAAVGQKDYQQSLFGVWNQIFSIPRPVKARRINPHDLPDRLTNSGQTQEAATSSSSAVTLS
ncbi:ATPase AAA-type core, partial [Trinorchestia longiramus]